MPTPAERALTAAEVAALYELATDGHPLARGLASWWLPVGGGQLADATRPPEADTPVVVEAS